MVRISGIDLPRNKRIEIGLTYIFGIGLTSSKADFSVNRYFARYSLYEFNRRVKLTLLRTIIDEQYQTEGDLRRVYSLNIKRLTDIGSAQGRRHRVGLPVRGQRTRTNARTRKGKIKNSSSKEKS